ncbi:hypothetical protein V8E36_002758 [Tilletia maclaganii]
MMMMEWDGAAQDAMIAHLHRIPSSEEEEEENQALALALALATYIHSHSASYIWHTGHPPTITITTPSSSLVLTLHLQTPINAPDTDEWYALHLLLRFIATHPSGRSKYAVHATDSDGDFLLIQGADELPDWIEPANAQNRVWLLPSSQSTPESGYPYASLHLLGPSAEQDHAQGSLRNSLSIATALSLLQSSSSSSSSSDQPKTSRAPSPLQQAALEPMLAFTASTSSPFSNIHKTLAYLPHAGIANLLTQEPQLCAQALGALEGLSADQVDRRVLARMERFGPFLTAQAGQPSSSAGAAGGDGRHGAQAREDVLAVVPLTQALYALALHLVFFPPKPHFSQAWRDAVASYRHPAPPSSSSSSSAAAAVTGSGPQSLHQGGPKIVEIGDEEDVEDADQRRREEGRWRDVGAKLVCGLELLYARGKERLRKAGTGVARPVQVGKVEPGWDAEKLDELRRSPEYTAFINTLTSYGYFTPSRVSSAPLLQGSREWYELEQRALESWAEQRLSATGSSSPRKGEDSSSWAARYELVSVPALIDAIVPPASTSSSGGGGGGMIQDADAAATGAVLADQRARLADLLQLESSTQWLDDLQRGEGMLQGDHDRSGGGEPRFQRGEEEEDDALQRLQKLMHGTTEFVEVGQGDYRGAMFDDEQQLQPDPDEDASMDSDDDSGSEDDEMDEDDGDEEEERRADRAARRRARSQLRKLAPEERARRMGELVSGVAVAEWGADAAAAAAVAGGSSSADTKATDGDVDRLRAKAREEVQRLRAQQQSGGSADAAEASHVPPGADRIAADRPGDDEAKARAAAQAARQRHVDLASALDAIPRKQGSSLASSSTHESASDINNSRSSSSALIQRNSSSMAGGPETAQHRALVQEQLRADAKLLQRDKHDGVSEDEGLSSGDENDGRPKAGGAAASKEEKEERAARERKLKLHELPVVSAIDADSDDDLDVVLEPGRGAGRQSNVLEGTSQDEGEDEEAGRGPLEADGPGYGPQGQERGDDEMAQFLEFTRKELGIDEALWTRIQADRRRDGRYLPPSGPVAATAGGASSPGKTGADTAPESSSSAKKVRFDGFARGFLNKKTRTTESAQRKQQEPAKSSTRPGVPSTAASSQSRPKAKVTSLWTAPPDSDDDDEGAEETTSRMSSVSAEKGQDHDAFYALMDQMDAELAKAKRKDQSGATPSGHPPSTRTSAGQRAQQRPDGMDLDADDDPSDDDDDELDAQDAELLRKLVSGQGDALRQQLGNFGGGAGGVGKGDGEGEGELSAGMLANFLESLKAQGSGPGPVSNLAGRLGVGRLPRDEMP